MKAVVAVVLLFSLGACTAGPSSGAPVPGRLPSGAPVPEGYCESLAGLLVEAESIDAADRLDQNAIFETRQKALKIFFSEKIGDPPTSPAYAVAEAIRLRGSPPAMADARDKVARQCEPGRRRGMPQPAQRTVPVALRPDWG